MYSTIKGGAAAIAASHRLLARQRRGDRPTAAVQTEQIRQQLGLAVDRVMAEASLYAPPLAALAIKQAQGDLVEAAYLLRAFRATLARIGASTPLDTARMTVRRQISTTYKNVPGGQILGATYDYTHRLLDFALMAADEEDSDSAPEPVAPRADPPGDARPLPNADLVEAQSTVDDAEPHDITRAPPELPATRDQRLQALARGDEGFLTGLAYSAMRGYGRAHPFLATLKVGDLAVELFIPELGETVAIGEIAITECVILNKRVGRGTDDDAPRFLKGYGLAFGRNERKAMAMAVLDLTLRTRELGDPVAYPAQDEEFVLSHLDNVDASGLVQHLKLPHYVDFQAEAQSIREIRDRQRGPSSVETKGSCAE